MTAENDLYDTLAATNLLVNDSSNRFFQQYRLGTTRYYALAHIQKIPGITLSELSEKLLCTKGNTTRIIRSLEVEGLLARATDAQDNRAFRLTLTPQGQARLEETTAAYRDFNRKRFACLDAAQQEQFRRQLETLNRHLEGILRDFNS